MKTSDSIVSDLSCWVMASIFAVALLLLALRLYDVQVADSAAYNYRSDCQSVRRVQMAAPRGRIFDRNGQLLAGSRQSVSIVANAEYFQRRSWKSTEEALANAVSNLAVCVGKEYPFDDDDIHKYVNRMRSIPLTIWRDVDHITLARFLEHIDEFPGFECVEDEERYYPGHSLAAHTLGYVGRDYGERQSGDQNFSFLMPELRGRSGLESYYDMFLRGVPGEKRIRVDARCFTTDEWVIREPTRGPDLQLSLDANLQRAVEAELSGLRGACAVIDPRNGDVLALASAPTYDLNIFVPRLRANLYEQYATDPSKPLLNRASGGAYAPGSTFKPITAMAGLSIGVPSGMRFDCCGVYTLGKMHLHCARRWGHGSLDMRHALRESCNPYFCNLGMDVGTNQLIKTAKAFGLGSKTGIDLGVDMAGTVPDGDWKFRTYGEKWYQGDLAQMSIGQGMLLVSPLQMARVAGAIGTGYLVTPHLKKDALVERSALPFSIGQLKVVREGMRMVVDGGTGRRGGECVPVAVSGKTGTAEVGKGETRRKNTWFIAYAPSENPVIAIAMVIENGQSGGGTTAPKVANILRKYFETL